VRIYTGSEEAGHVRTTRYRGMARVRLHASWVAAAHNLLRLAKLLPSPA
jgi:hypothetical protein